MKLLIIRHGDPDYVHDSLTEKGDREAQLLAERISRLDVKDFYVSPMGRAKRTAKFTLEKMGRTAIVFDWLKEFHNYCHKPNVEGESIYWDWLPQDWTIEPRFFDKEHWWEPKVFSECNIKAEYDEVIAAFDQLLAEHGYVRDGNMYRVEEANNDTLVFFCHFGLSCVLLSHLMNVSPMILWHGAVAAPTSVTTLASEERIEGKAYFRMSAYGDISHLYAGNEPPAFAARFCECYKNKDERH